MIRPADCIGIVLAGGRSRRMGCDKARLQWHGQSLLERALQCLANAGAGACRVSGNRPEPDALPDPQAFPQAGPLAGLWAAACAYPDRALVVVPVDMPHLPPEWLRRLIHALNQAPATQFVGKPLPLAFWADAHARRSLHAALADPRGKRAVGAWLAGLPARALPIPSHPANALDNLNRPEEWAALEADAGGRGKG